MKNIFNFVIILILNFITPNILFGQISDEIPIQYLPDYPWAPGEGYIKSWLEAGSPVITNPTGIKRFLFFLQKK